MTPRATYRMQFHKGFTFADAAKLAPYLAHLGISHLYSSPVQTARAGSMHGYDVIDHTHINPELGGEEGFRALATTLRAHDIGIVLDIVPNHMAVGGADNLYWLDVLEKGRDSVFANVFDIDWEPSEPGLRDKILAPLLGTTLDEAIESDQLQLTWDAALGKLAFAYAEHRFPLRPDDYDRVARGRNPDSVDLSVANEPAELRALLARQNFRLAYWGDAGERINWRRFFDVTSLAALRIEDDGVFELVHGTILRLYGEGVIDGLRVDHVDGLADPRAYCVKLRARLEALLPSRVRRDPPYIVVEKILAPGETLPLDWKVDGTTGYDFMNQVSALQHDDSGAGLLADLWVSISGRSTNFADEEVVARREVLIASFGGALSSTAFAFLVAENRPELDTSLFEDALTRILEHFVAYRTYATGDAIEPRPGVAFDAALTKARAGASPGTADALEAIAAIMRGDRVGKGPASRDAVRRFNQLASPLAAKAVEDTALYRYGRLVSRNDVGFSPAQFSIDKKAFCRATLERAQSFPRSLLTTATHDHKRGEDVRARLAVLSEIPEIWDEEVRVWFALNEALRSSAIEPADEYQLYQTLVGSWPFDGNEFAAAQRASFVERILAWREKSLREAKLRTSWAAPDASFEKANADFVRVILDPERSKAFLERLSAFAARIAPAGALNSLVQCALRYTCPGVPDLYQGCELWDLSLVDPDNRREVDFDLRASLASGAPRPTLAEWRNGTVKLALIQRLLALRREAPDCFEARELRPVTVVGERSENVVSFLLAGPSHSLLVAVPRLCSAVCLGGEPRPEPNYWKDAQLRIPSGPRSLNWRNALAEDDASVSSLSVCNLLARLPVAVLVAT